MVARRFAWPTLLLPAHRRDPATPIGDPGRTTRPCPIRRQRAVEAVGYQLGDFPIPDSSDAQLPLGGRQPLLPPLGARSSPNRPGRRPTPRPRRPRNPNQRTLPPRHPRVPLPSPLPARSVFPFCRNSALRWSFFMLRLYPRPFAKLATPRGKDEDDPDAWHALGVPPDRNSIQTFAQLARVPLIAWAGVAVGWALPTKSATRRQNNELVGDATLPGFPRGVANLARGVGYNGGVKNDQRRAELRRKGGRRCALGVASRGRRGAAARKQSFDSDSSAGGGAGLGAGRAGLGDDRAPSGGSRGCHPPKGRWGSNESGTGKSPS